MTGYPPNNSRNREDQTRIDRQATDFVWAVRMDGIDQAAIGTIHWSRRNLLDIALELAQRHIDAGRALEAEFATTARSAQHRGRIAHEEATWTDDEARSAYQRYRGGDRTSYIREGHRVWSRRLRRARGAKALAIRYGQPSEGSDVA